MLSNIYSISILSNASPNKLFSIKIPTCYYLFQRHFDFFTCIYCWFVHSVPVFLTPISFTIICMYRYPQKHYYISSSVYPYIPIVLLYCVAICKLINRWTLRYAYGLYLPPSVYYVHIFHMYYQDPPNVYISSSVVCTLPNTTTLVEWIHHIMVIHFGTGM